ncbi:unnamed protein product [Pleuronectes platessa]|uniref:Uncharacterized protein n=1 Tax=Pleuronectes platessa TaxID=8262 RepID=A0A9N7TGP1_PLEPL|nr:unnamed protein product [Pleuronectes platessa]
MSLSREHLFQQEKWVMVERQPHRPLMMRIHADYLNCLTEVRTTDDVHCTEAAYIGSSPRTTHKHEHLAGAVAEVIREKGPTRVQSRRRRPPYPVPSNGQPVSKLLLLSLADLFNVSFTSVSFLSRFSAPSSFSMPGMISPGRRHDKPTGLGMQTRFSGFTATARKLSHS